MLSDFFCVEELKNTRTGGYDTEIVRKGQERNDLEKKNKQRPKNFKEIKSFWETFSASNHSVCKTTQMPQKENIKIGSKQGSNITPSGKTNSGNVTDRKTPDIDEQFKDDELCPGLDRSQNMNASETPKTETTESSLQNVYSQNVSRIGRQPEERQEITSNMNMLHGANQFESTLRRLHVYGTLCLR